MALRTNTIRRHFATNASAFSLGWTKVYTETSGGTFADVTTAASNTTSSDVTMLGASGDITNFGCAVKFDFLRLLFDTNPSGGTRTWEYWNGSTWSALTITVVAGSADLTGSTHELKWTPPTDWATTTVNSTSAYWVRSVNATLYGTPGVGRSFAPGPVYDFGGQMTIDIPENTSRTIRAAIIRCGFHASDVSPIQQSRISCKLGAAAVSYIVDSAQDWGAGNDNYQMAIEVEFDATSYFATNFGSGTSQTFDLGASFCHLIGGATGVIGSLQTAWAQVTITYEYSDSSLTTATKTVYIPIESDVSILGTSLTEVGTSQVPALDTFCPEASKSYKEICFVLRGPSTFAGSGLSAGTANVGFSLDAEAEAPMPSLTYQSGDAAVTHEVYHWVRNDMDTSATHAFKAKTSNVTILGAPYFGGYLAVTYTYNASTSTTILNSLLMPISGEACFVNPGNTSGDSGAGFLDFYVEEPATVTLKQSAIQVSFNTVGNTGGFNLKVGGQSFRTYTSTAAGNATTFFNLTHRLDSGGAQGSGLSLARGKNRVTFEYYYGSAASSYYQFSAVNALLILNYTSSKAAAGVGAHNHTTMWSLVGGVPDSGALSFVSGSVGPVIPDADYYINSVGHALWVTGPRTNGYTLNLKCERLSGEGPAVGWQDLVFQAFYPSSSQDGNSLFICNAEKYFRRGSWDGDADRMDVETARRYVIQQGNDSAPIDVAFLSMYVTYHAVTFAWAGTVTDGSAAPQVGATVTLHRNDTGEIVGTDTTDGSGNYSITWFDDTVDVHSQVRISGSLLGRSDDGNAS